jgi:uncharacterized membrane protein YfcA
MMTDLLLFGGAILTAAVVSGLAGFAFALIAVAVLLQIRSPTEATFVILCCSVLSQLISLTRLRMWPPPREAWVLIAAGLVGAPLGVAFLHWVDAPTMRIAVGAFLVVYCALVWRLPADFRISFGNRVSDAGVGFAGGVLGGAAGLSGALPTAWSLVRGWTPDVQRGVYQSFILALQAWSLLVFVAMIGVGERNVHDLLIAAPLLVLGVSLGLSLYKWIDRANVRRIVIIILMLSGLAALAGGAGAKLL